MSLENIKSFDTNLKPTMSNVTNGRVMLRFNNSVLVQKRSSSTYSNFIFNFRIIFELSNFPGNPTKTFPPKNVYLVKSN